MYDRCYIGRRGLKESFVTGVEEFIQKARQYKYYELDGGIRCPCLKYDGTRILKDEIIKVHLYKKGFKPNYWIWTDHGEDMGDVNFNIGDNCVSGLSSSVYITKIDQFRTMEEMVNSALWQHETLQGVQSSNIEEPPTEDTQQFYNLLAEANKPLFEGSSESKLSVCVRLLSYKSNWNVPNKCLQNFIKLLLEVLQKQNCQLVIMMLKGWYQSWD